MRLIHISLLAALVTGCGSDPKKPDADPFDTFQDCYDDHHGMEGFSTPCAIEICCIDHPIGPGATMANIVCGDTAAACMTYVSANVTDSADTTLTDDITSACQHYTVDGDHGGTGAGGMCGG